MKVFPEVMTVLSLLLQNVVANTGTENEIYTECGFEPVAGQPQALKFCNAYGQCIKTYCGPDHIFSKLHCGCIQSVQIPPAQSQTPVASKIQIDPKNSTSEVLTKPPPGAVVEVILGSADGLLEPSIPPDPRIPPALRKPTTSNTMRNESFMSRPKLVLANEDNLTVDLLSTTFSPTAKTTSPTADAGLTNTNSSATTTTVTPTSSKNKISSTSKTQKAKITFLFALTPMQQLNNETTNNSTNININEADRNPKITQNATTNTINANFPNLKTESLQTIKSTTSLPGYSQVLAQTILVNNNTWAPSIVTQRPNHNETVKLGVHLNLNKIISQNMTSIEELSILPQTSTSSPTNTQTSTINSNNPNVLSATFSQSHLTTETVTTVTQVLTYKSIHQGGVTPDGFGSPSSVSPTSSTTIKVQTSVHAEGSTTATPNGAAFNINNTETELACGSEVNVTGISADKVLKGGGAFGFVYIGTRGVTSSNGSLHFDGQSLFWIPFYKGNRFTSGITVFMTFKENVTFQGSQGLVSNCGGEAGPSFSITLHPQSGRIKFKAMVMSTKTTYPFQETLEVSVPYAPGTVKTLEMQCSGQKLVGRVDSNVAGTHIPSTEEYELSPRSKPLFVGTACPEEETENFRGDVSNFAVYRCVRAET